LDEKTNTMNTFTLFPAIDLKDGACVRLQRGEMDRATVYSADPAAQARAWQDAGFAWLHVVDLDGAFAGKPVNAAAVAAILRAVSIPVQLGGGIRDMAGIEAWLAAANSPAASSSASTRATAASPPKAGPTPRQPRRSMSHCASRTPAPPRSSTPISAATAC
jgi:phosphoribosylformimino-5-aminoimidazole carboxamide ribonucleotide (ProFAR) isomerase